MGNEQREHYVALLRELVKKATGLIQEIDAVSGKLAGETDVDISALSTEREDDYEEVGDVVEGVFSGIEFVGRDGQARAIPQNYASKSKLVEGDLLKLTIRPNGTFIYKQIGPVERERIRGTLARDKQSDMYIAIANDQPYKLLTASVTYHHGEVGDEVVLLVPKGGRAQWAAVENIIQSNQ
jgi:hypothetical protein